MKINISIVVIIALATASLFACSAFPDLLQPSITESRKPTISAEPGQSNNSSSSSANATTSPGDSAVLFFDDFSDSTSGWETETEDQGSKGYSNGSYSISVNEKDYCHWTPLTRTFSDVTVQVDTKWQLSTSADEFGVICRQKDSDNFYYGGITSDGYFGIGKLRKGKWIDLGNQDWAQNDQLIHTGSTVNHLKFTCDYDKLTLEVNGSVLLQVSDSDFRTGDVGLYVCAYDEPGVEVQFDNFIVTKP